MTQPKPCDMHRSLSRPMLRQLVWGALVGSYLPQASAAAGQDGT